MQKVSKAYRDSMKSSLRERAYIMLSFGLINQEAQAKATVEDGDFAYYANAKNVLGEKSDDTVYATLEEIHSNWLITGRTLEINEGASIVQDMKEALEIVGVSV